MCKNATQMMPSIHGQVIFAKAYRQVPIAPEQLHLAIVAQWHPVHKRVVYVVPYAQLIGGRTPPLHFARHPAWFTYLLAASIALPTHHCVDDMVGVDRRCIAKPMWQCWRQIVAATGWEVPDSKSPPPATKIVALGALVDRSLTPQCPSFMWITPARNEAISETLVQCLRDNKLGPGEASKLWGRLQ